MFFKVEISDAFKLVIGKEEEEPVLRTCSNCEYDGWTCKHPKALDCPSEILAGGEFLYFKEKKKGR